MYRQDNRHEIIVRSIADLPDPSGGIITLNQNNIIYKLDGYIELGTNKINIADDTIVYFDSKAPYTVNTLDYQGTDPLFNGAYGGLLSLNKVTITCPHAPVFGFDNSGTQRYGLNCFYAYFYDFKSLGEVKNCAFVTMFFMAMNGFYLVNGGITSVADAGGGDVTVTTDAAHGLYNGETVRISGTTNYNGDYTISSVTSNTFDVTAAFVSTETGSWLLGNLLQGWEFEDVDYCIDVFPQWIGGFGTANMYNFDGTFNEISVIGGMIEGVGSENVFDIDSAATIGAGTINSANITLYDSAQVFASGSKTQSDPNLRFLGNNNIPDSTVSGEMLFVGAAYSILSIIAQNAQTFLNVSTWTSAVLERLTFSSTGYFTYSGEEDITLVSDGNINIAQDIGTNAVLTCQTIVIYSSSGQRTVTFSNVTNVINETTTPRANGDMVTWKNSSGTMPTGLSKEVAYYIVNKATNTFQVSYTAGGSAISFSDDGVATLSYEICELHGSKASSTVDSNVRPIDIIPQALFQISKNDQIHILITNTSAANDIRVYNGYIRIKA